MDATEAASRRSPRFAKKVPLTKTPGKTPKNSAAANMRDILEGRDAEMEQAKVQIADLEEQVEMLQGLVSRDIDGGAQKLQFVADVTQLSKDLAELKAHYAAQSAKVRALEEQVLIGQADADAEAVAISQVDFEVMDALVQQVQTLKLQKEEVEVQFREFREAMSLQRARRASAAGSEEFRREYKSLVLAYVGRELDMDAFNVQFKALRVKQRMSQ